MKGTNLQIDIQHSSESLPFRTFITAMWCHRRECTFIINEEDRYRLQ
jgi:hypothetical protein